MTDKEYYAQLWEQSFARRSGCFPTLLCFIVAFSVFFLSSCATSKKIEYIDRETIKYETIVTHDTITNNIHDSIRIEKSGDTVLVDRWHTVYRERISAKTDTCWKDSVLIQNEEVVVEKKYIPKWCYYTLVVCVLFVILIIYKFIRWLRA